MLRPFVEPCSRGVIGAQPCPRELGREISPQRRRMVLAGCVLASSMAFIDGTALTVALPKLRAAVDADLTSVQWVLNGYALALASLTLIGGAFADAYGRARMLSTGSLLFGAASICCALAPSIIWLIAARVLQGIAAALMTPASLALIGATYPRDERNRAIGVGGRVLPRHVTASFLIRVANRSSFSSKSSSYCERSYPKSGKDSVKEPRPTVTSARPLEAALSVENLSKTRIGSSELSTVMAEPR
jgi:hypothetical protein